MRLRALLLALLLVPLVPLAMSQGAATVKGVVYDADGNPADAALVYALWGGAWSQARSAADGSYALTGSGDITLITAFGDGGRPLQGAVEIDCGAAPARCAKPPPGGQASLDLHLPRASSIAGNVTGPRGERVRANVSAIRSPFAGTQSLFTYASYDKDTFRLTVPPGGYSLGAVAADGSLRFPFQRLCFSNDPACVLVREGETTWFDLNLDPAGALAGIVRQPSGAPLAGAIIQAGGEANKTGADGAFQLLLRPGRPARIEVTIAEDAHPEPSTLDDYVLCKDTACPDVQPGAILQRNITLPLAARISWSVVDENGTPVDIITDLLVGKALAPDTSSRIERGAPNGTFTALVLPGCYALDVTIQDIGPHAFPAGPCRDVAAGETLAFQHTVYRGALVRGFVKLEDGTPVEGARVFVGGQTGASAADGSFAIHAPSFGAHAVVARRAPEGSPLPGSETIPIGCTHKTLCIVTGPSPEERLNVTLPRLAQLRIRTHTANAKVLLTWNEDENGTPDPSENTGAFGEFALVADAQGVVTTRVEPGAYDITAQDITTHLTHRFCSTPKPCIRLAAGDSSSIDIATTTASDGQRAAPLGVSAALVAFAVAALAAHIHRRSRKD